MVNRSSPGPLDRVAHRGREQRRAVLAGGGEDGRHQLLGQAGAGRVVDGHELAGRPDPLERPGDGVGPLGASLDHVEVEERDLVAIPPVEQLAILGRDRHDDLLDLAVGEERVEGAEPDGPALELGVDLLLLRVAEPRGSPGGGKDHGELAHGSGSWGPGGGRDTPLDCGPRRGKSQRVKEQEFMTVL